MNDTKGSPLAGLVFGFLLVLLCWGLWIAAGATTDTNTGDWSEDAKNAYGFIMLMGLIACVVATGWFANLVHHAVTGKGFDQ